MLPVSRFCFPRRFGVTKNSGFFYIAGPTASGKTEIAVGVAECCQAEIVGADAFQLYTGLPRLTAQPDATTLQRVRHHLIGSFGLAEQMSAAKFATAAHDAIAQIQGRGQNVIVVGGSGLYVHALTVGLSPLPPGDPALRERLEQLSLTELNVRLRQLDPGSALTIDTANRRRLIRSIEICLLTGKPAWSQRITERTTARGVFLFRDRDDLNQRINSRVERMFAEGVVEEVQAITRIGSTASQTLGLREIRALLDGKTTLPQCIAAIQQATRRYAKRQLTWFRRQSNFEPLNLSPLGTPEAIELIVQKARLSFAR
ncbi:MAG: tRNA (adenosine(37)-N6)-dimethylallyltransferase MiaA [Chthoniobacterales bacterium]